MTWHDDAACHNVNPELFFPISYLAHDQIREAKTICNACPVKTPCLHEAMRDRSITGIWGGTTELDRWPDEAKCGTGAGIPQHKRRGEALCRKCIDFDNARRATDRARKAARRQEMEVAS